MAKLEQSVEPEEAVCEDSVVHDENESTGEIVNQHPVHGEGIDETVDTMPALHSVEDRTIQSTMQKRTNLIEKHDTTEGLPIVHMCTLMGTCDPMVCVCSLQTQGHDRYEVKQQFEDPQAVYLHLCLTCCICWLYDAILS